MIFKVMTMATNDKSGAIEKFSNVPVLFEDLQAGMDSIFRDDISFHISIGRPTIKRLGRALDVKAEEVWMDYLRRKAVVPMLLEYSQRTTSNEESDREDSIYESSGKKAALKDAKVQGRLNEAIVLNVKENHERNGDSAEENRIEDAVYMKLRQSHLSERSAKDIKYNTSKSVPVLRP